MLLTVNRSSFKKSYDHLYYLSSSDHFEMHQQENIYEKAQDLHQSRAAFVDEQVKASILLEFSIHIFYQPLVFF